MPEYVHLSKWIIYALELLYIGIVIAAVVVVLRENRNPIRALSWVIALIFLPGIGLIFYLFFGRSLRGEMMTRQNRRRMMKRRKNLPPQSSSKNLPQDARHLMQLGQKIGKFPYTYGNEIEIFTDGKSKFESLKKDLRNARKSILLQYYIFLDDSIGKEIAEILMEKAREGLEVKVIYDHVGSFRASNRFFKKMEKAGVETQPFFRVNFPQFANRINWRNHRKIVVIDNKVGYIGGMNIADRYAVDAGKGRQVWRDTHFRVTGDITESLIYSFAIDWNFRKKEAYIPDFKDYERGSPGTSGIQLVTGGPVSQWNNLSLMYLKVISSAKRIIWIQTPYFLPTDALFNALIAAALSDVDVRIMMPRHTDSTLLHYASFSYITQCLNAGIKVYLYQPGMLHAKAMIIDDNLVTAGSTNFDFRSFENNFESNLFIYDEEFNKKMRDIFYSDMEKCERVRREMWLKRPLPHRFLESLLRLVSPIL